MVKVGDLASDFELSDAAGKMVRLGQFRGKNVVLYFYPKDETPGCTKEAHSFRDNYQLFKKMGAEVIGISADSCQSHQEFAKHHALQFILLSDSEKQVRKLYGVPSTIGLLPGRVTYIIDRNGVVRHIFSSQFRPKKHIEEALSALKALTEPARPNT